MSKNTLKRWAPLAVLVTFIATAFATGISDYFTLEALRENREHLESFVAHHPMLTAAKFVLIYAAIVALSIPVAVIFSIAGGFLFGTWLGGLLIVTGATLGATAVFSVARTAVGSSLRDRAGPWVARIEQGFQEDGVSYLLIMRLVPIFPFWLVNLVPAMLGIRIVPFVVTTFLGIMPGSFVFSSIGNGLGEIFDAGKEPDLLVFTKPSIIGPLLALAVLAAVPIIYKKIRQNNSGS